MGVFDGISEKLCIVSDQMGLDDMVWMRDMMVRYDPIKNWVSYILWVEVGRELVVCE